MLSRPAEPDVVMAAEMAELCKALHVLPGPGGLLDQDWLHVAMLKAGLRAIAIREEREVERQKRQAKHSR